jgi:hypothetical protein
MTATSGGGGVSNSVIVERVNLVLQEIIQIKKDFSEFRECNRQFVLDYERRHAVVDSKADRAHARIDEHERVDFARWKEVDLLRQEVKSIETIIDAIEKSNQERDKRDAKKDERDKILFGIWGLAGTSVVLWFVNQLLGLL